MIQQDSDKVILLNVTVGYEPSITNVWSIIYTSELPSYSNIAVSHKHGAGT